jgi:hypothetical protein
MNDRDRVALATGRRPVSLRPARGHGAPSNRRWVATFDDDATAFVKVATFDYTANWLRLERRNYELLEGEPYLPRLLGWHDDGNEPALVLEDLSAAAWPPPWTPAAIDAVLRTLEEVQATPAPDPIPDAFGEMFDIRHGWELLRTHPSRVLALGVFDRSWLATHGAQLEMAARDARLAGDALLHADVRSDNLCIRGGRALLVDWNWACRGAANLDLAAWLPSLAHEGGPQPWILAPGQAPLASLPAGYFLEHAAREPIPQAPHVRQLQLDQGIVALRWASRELRIPSPE